MARGLKLFMTVLLMVAFFGTSMAQAIPSPCALQMAMAGQTHDSNSAPCKGTSHDCQDMLGCVATMSVTLVDFTPSTETIVFATVTRYSISDQLLEGRSIAPDLPVPILPA